MSNIFKSPQENLQKPVNSIFLKQTDFDNDDSKTKVSDKENVILSRRDVANMIPKECLKQKNLELMKTKIEWRWRIFKFQDREHEIVEISQKKPNKKRLYINNKGEWVEFVVSEDYDVFVIHEYYHYIDEK
jgi:hypothetical protein